MQKSSDEISLDSVVANAIVHDNEAQVFNEISLFVEPTPEQLDKILKGNSVSIKVFAFGSNGLLFAIHLVINGAMLSSIYGEDGSAASAAMATTQSLIVGGSLGFLLGAGLQFSKALGARQFRTAGQVAQTAFYLSQALGLVASAGMLSTKILFPMIYESSPANIASNFFVGYAASAFPLMYLVAAPQVAFAHGDTWVPPVSMASVVILSAAASYILGFNAELGAFGVGLGGLVGSSLSAMALRQWITRDDYSFYYMRLWSVEDFPTKAKDLLRDGWKLSFQRLTEWGNLFAITTIIGSKSTDDLVALNPSLLMLIITGTAQQGVALAAGMMVSKAKGALSAAIPLHDAQSIHMTYQKVAQESFRSVVVGTSVNSLIAMSVSLARKPICNAFLSDSVDDDTVKLAQQLLVINMIGLVFDGVRIIASGSLRGWNALLSPTCTSAIAMTLGIIVAASIDVTDSKLQFVMRDLAMGLAGAIILYHLRHEVLLEKDNAYKFSPQLMNRKRSLFVDIFCSENEVPNGSINEPILNAGV